MKTQIKLTLSNEELNNLLELLSNSNDTGNKEWDKSIKGIEKQLKPKL